MKKYLMTGVAALVLSAGFTSCSHDEDFEPITQAQIDKAKYDQAFLAYVGGKIASNQDWGFSSVAGSRMITRANAVIQGDPFTFESTDALYKDEAPASAKTYADYCENFKRADWGGAIDYNAAQAGDCELLIPEGTHELKFTGGSHDFYVTGDATLSVPDFINQARIYVLPDVQFTLNMNNYINNLEIYVASGATLNYNYAYLYNQTGGGKIYNRGTVNVPDNFEINQDAIFYNEGVVNGKDFTSKPQDSKPSFLYNFGTLNLSGDMILNSCANFFNEGTVIVGGNTEATQRDIWWINKGTYTTNTLTLHPWNKTFYNYCQLMVVGNAHMYNGEFTLMDNSYMECATAEFDNFVVNLGGNSGFNCKGNNSWGGQGDGTYQGFRTTGSKSYVRLGGTTTVAGHLKSLELSGNITYAINNIVDLGANDSGVQPTYVFNDGTIAIPFDKLTVTPNTNDCGATWTVEEDEIVYDIRIMGEDLSAQEAGDFDFNDIVLDVKFGNPAMLCLRAAGGTLPLMIADNPDWEVHKLFQVGEKVMVNTAIGKHTEKDPVPLVLNRNIPDAAAANGITLKVYKNGEWQELTAKISEPAAKIAVPVTTDDDWLDERESIKDKKKGFVDWAQENKSRSTWWTEDGE